MKTWLLMLRSYSRPLILVPVALGSAAAWRQGGFSWTDLALTGTSALMAQTAAGLGQDYFRTRKAADRAGTPPPAGAARGHSLRNSPLTVVPGLLAAGTAMIFLLAFKNNIHALPWLAAAGFALAWLCTATAFPRKHPVPGTAVFFLVFGPGIVCGAAFIQSGSLIPEALWASIPFGLLLLAVRQAGNIAAVKNLPADKFAPGAGAAKKKDTDFFQYALIFSPYVFSLTFGSIWPAVFCALSVPLAVKISLLISKGDFPALPKTTARLAAAYGLLLSAGLCVAG